MLTHDIPPPKADIARQCATCDHANDPEAQCKKPFGGEKSLVTLTIQEYMVEHREACLGASIKEEVGVMEPEGTFVSLASLYRQVKERG